ncbi:MAG: DUF2520 domain-containing protein [Thermoanaerobaculaceae bacterium]|nr:DUF2520 domain-containing protein [Thermoanaerobaculaceae bacterium]
MRQASLPVVAVVDPAESARRAARRWLPGVPVLASTDALPGSGGVLLAVPDRLVATCAAELAGRLRPEVRVVLHTAGALPAEVLKPLRARRRSVGSIHPLMAFSRGGGPLHPLAGVTAAVEGDTAAVRTALSLARSLGMRGFRIAAGAKPLYHATAAVAANLVHVLVAAACSELSRVGPSRRRAAEALRPLVLEAVTAALASGDLSNLTGPLVRGDVATVRSHLRVLSPDLAAVYTRVAGLAVRRLEGDRLISPETAVALATALTNPNSCDSVGFVRSGEEG